MFIDLWRSHSSLSFDVTRVNGHLSILGRREGIVVGIRFEYLEKLEYGLEKLYCTLRFQKQVNLDSKSFSNSINLVPTPTCSFLLELYCKFIVSTRLIHTA